MITLEDFQAAVTSLLQLLPMQRQLTPAALVLAWDTFPASARRDLSGDMLRFAVSQRLLDPDPPKDQAPHLALLRYLYPTEHNRPVFDRGLRGDLRERMRQPEVFHDPAPARLEQAAAQGQAPRLPGGGKPWHPSQLSEAHRLAHVERVAAKARQLIASGPDQREWKGPQLLQGLWWFRKALQGFWLLEADGGGIAAAWLTRNPEWAEKLISEAFAGQLKAGEAESEAITVGLVRGLR